jgi:hypothetical protein
MLPFRAALTMRSSSPSEKLGAALGHDVSHQSAHGPEAKQEPNHDQAIAPQQEIGPRQEQVPGLGISM